MTDFVLEQQKNHLSLRDFNIKKYANLLKQPLTLGMFVPCSNEHGLPLSLDGLTDSEGYVLDNIEFKEYQLAKAKVLFNNVKIQTEFIDFYGGIRVFNFNKNLNQKKWFSEVFEKDGKPRFKKTIEDLIVFDLDLVVSF